jgi:hypothetical protein
MATNDLNTLKALIAEQEALNQLYLNATDIQQKKDAIEKQILNDKMLQREQERLIGEMLAGNLNLSKEDLKTLNGQVDRHRKINEYLKDENKNRKTGVDLVKKLNTGLSKTWEYLMQSDKVIRETIRNLGMSGAKADAMRKSFELSAMNVARMGGSLATIQSVMEGYAEETGRARALTASMVEDITSIGLGTGLGIEQATKLGAQFELMGFDARKTAQYVQGIVDTSERMGVNTTKVLKNLNDNFKKVNTYSFKSGSKGIAEMAMNAEKFRVDMKDALSAADAAKSLEKAIDLAANLQVMGGEFAKTDPLEWMYLARNEPDKLTKKLSEMTRGLVTFKKNSEGTFEKFISPADRQRLESVAQSLGITAEQMTEITERRAELDLMARQLAGTGLTDREKELVEGAAIFNAKSGKFEVQLAGRMQDISTLTANQAKSFVKEQASLKERAMAAQTFDEALKATIEEFKTVLLPMLKGINDMLKWVRPIAVSFNNFINSITKTDLGGTLLKAAGWMMAAGFLINKAVIAFSLSGKGLGERLIDKISGNGTKTTGLGGYINQRSAARKARLATGGGISNPNAGKGLMRGGTGIGAAALGIGAGIGAAAAGISLLADSMSKLTPQQAETLKSIVSSIGWFVVGGIAAAVGISLIGKSAELSAAGLGMLSLTAISIGAAMVGVGFGIKLAADGLANLVISSKGAGTDMLKVAGGIAAIGASLAMFSFGGIGLGVFAATMATIALTTPALVKAGTAFEQMGNAVLNLKGTKEDFVAIQNAVESISKANNKGGGMLAELATLLKSPLKVEFVDKNVAVVSDITLNIDGQKFMQKVYKAPAAVQKNVEAKTQGLPG